MSRLSLGRAFCAISFAIALTPHAAFAQSAEVGTLQCHLSGGVGMIIIENQALDCVFNDASGAPPSHYIGRLTNVGANIGISGPGQLIWTVVAATRNSRPRRARGRLCWRARLRGRRRRSGRRRACRRLRQDHLLATRFGVSGDRAQCFRRSRQCQPPIYACDAAASLPCARR